MWTWEPKNQKYTHESAPYPEKKLRGQSLISFVNSLSNEEQKVLVSKDDIFKCTCMLADIEDWPLMSLEYKKFFNPDKLPARSAFAGSGLALGAKLEIECMAIKRK